MRETNHVSLPGERKLRNLFTFNLENWGKVEVFKVVKQFSGRGCAQCKGPSAAAREENCDCVQCREPCCQCCHCQAAARPRGYRVRSVELRGEEDETLEVEIGEEEEVEILHCSSTSCPTCPSSARCTSCPPACADPSCTACAQAILQYFLGNCPVRKKGQFWASLDCLSRRVLMLVPQCVEATPELLKTPHQGVLGSPNQVLFRRSMDEKTRQTPVLFLHDNSFFCVCWFQVLFFPESHSVVFWFWCHQDHFGICVNVR